eukprot:TRINITY_DN37774_c0_g1_i1.p1 TRINITY_DN37774_c0_g1~~TRINITY_DN37774_c0_g1_i1.p1  ORF type:complete len:408 (+),score=123.67 TRINITY_DN37774_c0_g1_i1:139-1362(+)
MGKGGGGGGGVPTKFGWICLKVACPDELVKALMGPRGVIKTQIEKDTGCKLVFSQKDEYYPGTQLRVMGIYANEMDWILAAFNAVVQKTMECGKAERKGGGKGHKESLFLGKENGEYQIRLCLSRNLAGAVIGGGANNIKELRAASGCKVFIDNEACDGHRLARIIGVQASIADCMNRIAHGIVEETGTPEYAAWADNLRLDPSKSDLGPKRPRQEGEGEDAPAAKRSTSMWQPAAPPPPAQVPAEATGKTARPPPPPARAPARPAGDTDVRITELGDAIGAFQEGEEFLTYSVTFPVATCRLETLLQEEFFSQVEDVSHAEVKLPEDEADNSGDAMVQRYVSVVGTILSIYYAHLLILKRVKELERDERQAEKVAKEEDPDVLKAKIRELQAALAKERQADAKRVR